MSRRLSPVGTSRRWRVAVGVGIGAAVGWLSMELVSLSGAWFELGALRDVGDNVGPLGGLGAGGAAGGAVANQSDDDYEQEEEEENDCAQQERSVLECRSRVETYEAQLDHYGQQIKEMKADADRLAAEAMELAPDAQSEVAWHLAQALITKLTELFVSYYGGPVAGAIGAFTNPAGAVPGVSNVQAYVGFFQELSGYFELFRGDLDAVQKLAEREVLTNTKRWVDKMRQLQDIASKGRQTVNRMNEIRSELDTWKQKLEEAQDALRQCRAASAAAA